MKIATITRTAKEIAEQVKVTDSVITDTERESLEMMIRLLVEESINRALKGEKWT